ncbi:MAG TPA: magnesium transporter CorA family protein [Paracoccaceae bacterium]|nr:magnesium transporter CorA family protein [Paracoccaceae bacterium]
MRQDYLADPATDRLTPVSTPAPQAIWTDLLDPTADEEAALEAELGLDLPTRDDMRGIEPSARIYSENGIQFLTANVLAGADTPDPVMEPVTFVLTRTRVVTIRYHRPYSLSNVPQRAAGMQADCSTPIRMLMTLMEVMVDRGGDILEAESRKLDLLSRQIFQPAAKGAAARRSVDLSAVIAQIGRHGELNSRLQDSLVTIERIVNHLAQMRLSAHKDLKITEEGHAAPAPQQQALGLNGRDKRLLRDIRSLIDYAEAQSGRVTFMLDATLGLLNIQQNGIIKIFSVAAVVFLPPTLIASIYGMNFARMPELAAPYGYPLALGGMVLSAILPYLFFKRKGWL